MNDYDEFKIWYTQKAPDESEVTMVDMAAMAWQAARAASPKVPQSDLEIRCKVLTALLEEHVLLDHLDWDEDDWCRRAELALGPELGGVFNEMFEAKNKALPQGVDEWINQKAIMDCDVMIVTVYELRKFLSGMVIVPVEPTDEMVDAGYGALPDCKCTEGDKWRAKLGYKAMLAATKEKGE